MAKKKKRKRKPNPKRVPIGATYLSKEVYGKWSQWCEDRDINQQSYMSKIVRFMMKLDNSTRLLFLEAFSDEDRAALAKLILARIPKGNSRSKNPLSADDAVGGVVDLSATDASASIKKKETRRKTQQKPRKQA